MLFRHNITDYEHMRIASLFVLCLKELSHVIPIDWVAPPPAAPPVVVVVVVVVGDDACVCLFLA